MPKKKTYRVFPQFKLVGLFSTMAIIQNTELCRLHGHACAMLWSRHTSTVPREQGNDTTVPLNSHRPECDQKEI